MKFSAIAGKRSLLPISAYSRFNRSGVFSPRPSRVLSSTYVARPNPYLTGKRNLPKCIGILTGGGPAAGLNSVIASAALTALERGIEVIGLHDGYRHLMTGDVTQATQITEAFARNIALEGGTILGTRRDNPAKKDDKGQTLIPKVLETLDQLGIDALVAIGGDDTAFSASQIFKASGGRIRVASVPKTIDNDLPLPAGTTTFGFETARALGAKMVEDLRMDCESTGNWAVAVAMGRSAGHLALGIGTSAWAANTIIPEEFGSDDISFTHLVDIAEVTILKRQAAQKVAGVIVLAEGLAARFNAKELIKLGLNDVTFDPHGNIELSSIKLGSLVARELERRFLARKQKTRIIDLDVGYTLRSGRPVAFDAAYTKRLGFFAVEFLCHEPHESLKDTWGALITLNAENFVPVPYASIQHPVTGKFNLREVDVGGDPYAADRGFMERLSREDLIGNKLLDLAAAARMEAGKFKERYSYLI